jgi:hypothetical protein
MGTVRADVRQPYRVYRGGRRVRPRDDEPELNVPGAPPTGTAPRLTAPPARSSVDARAPSSCRLPEPSRRPGVPGAADGRAAARGRRPARAAAVHRRPTTPRPTARARRLDDPAPHRPGRSASGSSSATWPSAGRWRPRTRGSSGSTRRPSWR